jgi:UDP:flavonoid glycosyltransferase YjiC (YdhE family)
VLEPIPVESNMTRILIATTPAAGHVTPFAPLAKALVARGHDVRWYTASKYRQVVEASGASFAGYQRARDIDDAKLDLEFPQRGRLRGLAQLKHDMKHVFIDAAPDQLLDIRALLRESPADIVLHDSTMLGALFHHERGGPPSLSLGVTPLLLSSADTAPFGLGLQPGRSVLGRVRNRLLNAFVERLAFRDVQLHWEQTRAPLKLPPTGWWMNHVARATYYLQPTVPGFEYPRSALAENVRFIGMIPALPPSSLPKPEFWSELDGSRPIVHVTQGTLANTTPHLIGPALDALATEDVLVVISTGNRPPEQLGLATVPKNVRVAKFLSYPDLLPKVSVMVTNGGYGGVQTALSYGVPLVVAGESEDKPEVAARVAWSGAGINLKTGRPKPHALRQAVRSILANPSYGARARALAAEYTSYDALSRTIALIESTAAPLP